MINHYRALFPRWDFFDRIGYNFKIEYKLNESDVWQSYPFTQKRTFLSLFYNPDCNLALAHINIIEHFVRDTNIDSQKEVAFKMLVKLMKISLKQNKSFQFKVVACKGHERIDFFVSKLISQDIE